MAPTKVQPIAQPTEKFFTRIVLNREHLIAALAEPAKARNLEIFEAEQAEWGIEDDETDDCDSQLPTDEEIALSILDPTTGIVDPVELTEWLRPSIAQQFGIPESKVSLKYERTQTDSQGKTIESVEFELTIA